MGKSASLAEVSKGLSDLDLDWRERRPERLQALRDQIERNLSGMMGPVLARMIVDERLQLDTDTRTAQAQNVRLIEERLESSRSRFRGLAAELDQLRRYHRQILEDLPLGVVAVTRNSRIVRRNPAMHRLTGPDAGPATGRQLGELREPWGLFLANFLVGRDNHAYKQRLRLGGESRWLSLHKTAIGEPGRGQTGDSLLLVEDVTELQVLEEELTHSERLASIGRLAAGVAHEIGNPVTGIACLAQELRDPQADTEQTAEEILDQTQRINNIVQTLVSYAHAGANDERQPTEVALAEAVEEARRVVRLSKRARNMDIDVDIPLEIRVNADYQRRVQVFVNLFSNAVDACGDGGRVATTVTVHTGPTAHIRVLDNGPGIPATIRDKILEPFFTTKPPGKGTGLGLSLVYNIVKDHNGELHIPTRTNGAEFIIVLPLSSEGGLKWREFWSSKTNRSSAAP
jgi:PAS domain S-box-containing protein